LPKSPSGLREGHLDQGKVDTLALAERLHSRPVLMDETVGRQTARDRGLGVRGSLAVLVVAYQRGLIQAYQLRPCSEEMARRHDIWINPALVERLLTEVLEDG